MHISKTETLHCLFLLSSNEPPDPVSEVEWHARRWDEKKSPTFVATTRQIKGLRPGVSEIHFYGDSQHLGSAYLGGSIFHSYVPLGSLKGQEILNNSDLYKRFGCPAATRGFIGVTEFNATPGKSIDEGILEFQAGQRKSERLKAIMRAKLDDPDIDKMLLIKANLPKSAARIQIYFYKVPFTAVQQLQEG
jgi:hypothetical protein